MVGTLGLNMDWRLDGAGVAELMALGEEQRAEAEDKPGPDVPEGYGKTITKDDKGRDENV